LDSELNVASIQQPNKDDTSVTLFQSAGTNKKEDRRSNRPIETSERGRGGTDSTVGTQVLTETAAASVYDFSATKAETPPVPLQKARRDAAEAKSPRQVGSTSTNVAAAAAASKVEKQPQLTSSTGTGNTSTKNEQLDKKKQQHPQQLSQQQQQLSQMQQQHAQHYQPGSSSNSTVYQASHELGYVDTRYGCSLFFLLLLYHRHIMIHTGTVLMFGIRILVNLSVRYISFHT
jgi:hypothetical protein